MMLTVHSTAGIYLGLQISNPLIAFMAGFLSHLILDAIPHGDESIGNHLPKKLKIKRLTIISLIDLAGVALVFFSLLSLNEINLTTALLAGLLGSILPDFIWGAYEVLGWRWLGWITSNILDTWHKLTGLTISLKQGMIVQSLTFLLFIYLIIF